MPGEEGLTKKFQRRTSTFNQIAVKYKPGDRSCKLDRNGFSDDHIRQASWIHQHEKRSKSDEVFWFMISMVGIEPRKLRCGISALVWSLNIGI